MDKQDKNADNSIYHVDIYELRNRIHTLPALAPNVAPDAVSDVASDVAPDAVSDVAQDVARDAALDVAQDIRTEVTRHEQEYYVYIIRCSDDTLYTGTAVDVDSRVTSHNSGKGAKYTRGRLPVTLVYQVRHEGKSAALKRELEIKRMTRLEKLHLIEATCV